MGTSPYDRRVIVVGSGPAGAMAAHTLVQQGIPVTMLESGEHLPQGWLVRVAGKTVWRKWPARDYRQQHVTTNDPQALWHHNLEPGGLTNYWTSAVPRFAPQDFTDGARLHERYRWPLSYHDLLPYYEQAERHLVIGASPKDSATLPAPSRVLPCRLPDDWQRIVPHAAALGHGLTPTPLAEGPHWLVQRQGAAFNSFVGIVQRLLRSPLFELVLGAHVVRLEWSGERRKVQAVVYVDRTTGREERMPAAAVVVAAGPLASTKLLLQSTSADFPHGLGNTDDILGRYLHDHPHDWYVVEFDRPLSRLSHTAYLTRGAYDALPPLAGVSCTFGNADGRHTEKVKALLGRTTTRFGVVSFGMMVPTEKQYIALEYSRTDALGMPLLELHIRFGEEVQRTMLQARERMLAILDAAGYHGTIQGGPPVMIPGWSVHYGGTVRMHDSPRYGMLNGWNRLHAVANVVVADASSFTTGVEKNPTLTVMALAARAAHRLADDLKTDALMPTNQTISRAT